MMSLLSFLVPIILIMCMGKMLLKILGISEPLLGWLLALPVGALLNALMIFFLTIFSVSFSPLWFVGAYIVIFCMFFGIYSFIRPSAFGEGVIVSLSPLVCHSRTASDVACRGAKHNVILRQAQDDIPFKLHPVIWILLILLIGAKLLYGVSHGVVLPSFYYDTVSQWNMRAKISYEDRAIAFDTHQLRGISKPQYPILLHGLQIAAMQLQPQWSDRAANAATFLLTLASFAALFVLLMRMQGSGVALLILFGILAIPLMSIHLAQGHGDIHLITYLLLSAVTLMIAIRQRSVTWILLSGLFIAASAWTKQEGLFFGVFPWCALLVGVVFLHRSKQTIPLLFGLIPASLGGIWSIFLLLKGLHLTPNTSVIGFYPEALPAIGYEFIRGGSFGIVPFVLMALLGVVVWLLQRKEKGIELLREYDDGIAILAWSVYALCATFFIFVCTSNALFAVNHQTFARTMMIPLSLGILALISLIVRLLYHKRK